MVSRNHAKPQEIWDALWKRGAATSLRPQSDRLAGGRQGDRQLDLARVALEERSPGRNEGSHHLVAVGSLGGGEGLAQVGQHRRHRLGADGGARNARDGRLRGGELVGCGLAIAG